MNKDFKKNKLLSIRIISFIIGSLPVIVITQVVDRSDLIARNAIIHSFIFSATFENAYIML